MTQSPGRPRGIIANPTSPRAIRRAIARMVMGCLTIPLVECTYCERFSPTNHLHGLPVSIEQTEQTEQGVRTPQSGEPLILADGRRFVFATIENDLRGWWFTAFAHDGRS